MRLLIVLALLAVSCAPALASEIKTDEEILFFRTMASGAPGVAKWEVPLRGWVFEPERNSLKRRILMKAMSKALGLPAGSDELALFQARADLFLVDSERNKDIKVRFGVGTHDLARSDSSGLFAGVLHLTPWTLATAPEWVRYTAELPSGDPRRFEGQVKVVAPGTVGTPRTPGTLGTPQTPGDLGVISDIDDTIKVTVVRDRKEMLKNTFLRPFTAVTGMSAAYNTWARAGATFHYVSGSPWPLYPHLVRFMDESGFPAGSVHLKSLWGSSKMESEIEGSSVEHKLSSIETLFKQHPTRRFVMVGDSGEKDPEIYGEIARRHPARVRSIMIRKAPLVDETDARYQAAFKGVPRELWTVFAEPAIPPVR